MSTSPAANAAAVAMTTVVTATFSEAMDASTLTPGSFSLRVADSPVTGTVSCSGKEATFRPASPLPGCAAITVRLTTEVTDLAGNPLPAEHAWTFSTRFPRFAYVANTEDDTVSAYRVDPDTG